MNASPADCAIRITLINMIVHLLLADEIDKDDLEDCMDDFMETHFNVIADETSHKEMAEGMLKVMEAKTKLKNLQGKLEKAIVNEEYEKAGKLKDELAKFQDSLAVEVGGAK